MDSVMSLNCIPAASSFITIKQTSYLSNISHTVWFQLEVQRFHLSFLSLMPANLKKAVKALFLLLVLMLSLWIIVVN